MSTFTSEPGTKLGGRYRLEDRVAAAAGWAAWKAIDEILARAVTVITFAPGFPRIREVVTAARAASRLTDARLAQVFDVEEDWDRAYIVMEWAAGETLGDLLSAGPMEPSAGARIVAEAAAALSVAHSAGLAHLCLTPESLRWTTGGVKVTGLGIDAALAGLTADDPEAADTRALGRLLYATLTGLWPGPDYPALPPAPLSEGQPRSPRQVRAGVPAALDEVTCRALQLRSRSAEGGLTSPGALARALSAAIPPDPVPAAPDHPQRQDTRPAADRPYWNSDPRETQHWQERDRRRGTGSKVRVAVVALLSLIVIAGVVAATSPLWHHGHAAVVGHSHPAGHASPVSAVLTPVSASGFDPLTSVTDDPGDENSAEAENVLSHASGGWATQQYIGNAYFGGLKKGTGLILDMGKPVRVSSVTVQFAGIPGAEAQLKIGNSDARSPANLASMTDLTPVTGVQGSYTFTVHSSASGQFIVIWFTRLPSVGGGKFMGQITAITIQGAAA
ncbi:MAG: protein kinase family protein [Streptosporangiaceae bacterium]|jgi:hypothetical protein